MKVVFVTPLSWPAVGGRETLLRDLTRGLSGRGHHVRILSRALDPRYARGKRVTKLFDRRRFDPFLDDGVRIEPLTYRVPRRAAIAGVGVTTLSPYRRLRTNYQEDAARWYSRWASPAIARALDGAELVHLWSGHWLGAATLAAAGRLDVPVVITPFVHPGNWGEDPVSFAVCRQADAVVSLLAADLPYYRSIGVVDDRLHVSGACSRGVERGLGTKMRADHGISGRLLLFLGVRRAHKGLDLILRALEQMAREGDPVPTLAVVGPGPPVETADGFPLIDCGEVSDRDRAGWLEAADLLCFPSAAESFGLVVLEAWSAGTPVLVSPIPTLSELVQQAGGGIIVERDSDALRLAIRHAIANPAQLEAMARSGEALWRERYTVEAFTAWHERLYEELLSHP